MASYLLTSQIIFMKESNLMMSAHNLYRVLFMGTPDFAVPSLQMLKDEGYDVIGVVTQPDRPKGRRRELTPSPVKSAAIGLELPVYQPERLKDERAIDELKQL